MPPTLARYWSILKQTGGQWADDKAPQLGAALAFYSVLSIGPLLLIAIAIAGLMFGREAASGQIVAQMRGLIGTQGAEAIQTVLSNSRKPDSGIIAGLIGIVTLLIGASGVFGQLQDSLNAIWRVKPKPGGTLWRMIKERFLSFAMVLGIGFLLLISLILSAVLDALGKYFVGALPSFAPVLEGVNFIVTFGIATVLFAMIFKVLPDLDIPWSDVWGGAAITAALFTIGKWMIGLYLGHSAIGSTYGAAGSMVVLSLWIYYSAQILFFGAELTEVWSKKYGSRKEQAPTP